MVTSCDTVNSNKRVKKHGVVSGGRLEKTVKLLVSCGPGRKNFVCLT